MLYKPHSFDYSPAVLLCPVIMTISSPVCRLHWAISLSLLSASITPQQNAFKAKGRTSDGLSSEVTVEREFHAVGIDALIGVFIVAASSVPLRHCLRT